MGFGNVLTTGLAIILLLVTGYMILAGMIYTLDNTTVSAAAARDLKAGQAGTALNVSDVSKLDSQTLEFNLTNTGSAAIGNLSRMDVILQYVDPASGKRLSGLWLAPAAAGTPAAGDGQWSSEGLLSPLRNTTDTALLLPGERMTVRAALAAPMPSGAGTVSASAPNGVGGTAQFNFET